MVKRRRAKKKGKPRGTVGRRPTGIAEGELLSEYPRLTVRVPPHVRAALEHVANAQGRQQWRVLVDAILEYAQRTEP